MDHIFFLSEKNLRVFLDKTWRKEDSWVGVDQGTICSCQASRPPATPPPIRPRIEATRGQNLEDINTSVNINTAPSRYLPPCDHYHNEYQYYCHDHYCSLLAIFGRRSFALLHLANENVFSCLWRRRCSALSSLQSTELQDFSAAVGTFFRRDERKGNIFPSLTRHLPTLWRAIPTTFFSGMEPLPLQRSRIFRESFHFTHIRSHTHTLFLLLSLT